jgi:transcriptional regulator with XRE-family HTH domain
MREARYALDVRTFFMPGFSENLQRLLGLHRLRARDASELMGISPQALSEWMRGKRSPTLDTLLRVAKFFELPVDRLLSESFEDLLAHDVSDRDRFRRVEEKIRRRARRSAKAKRR